MGIDSVIERVRRTYGSWGRGTSVAQMRSDWDRLFAMEEGAEAGVAQHVAELGGVPARWFTPAGTEAAEVVLYLHGGGFQVGSTRSHAELMSGLAQAAGCRVVGLDYRLAPEHAFPAALDDARAAYEALRAEGIGAHHIALAGDSAGANLALGLALDLQRAAEPAPAACVLLSPWTDLSASGESYVSRAEADPIHQRPMILAMARRYLGAAGVASDPRASPLFAEAHALAGLPPLLIQVGDRETVLSDATAFAAKAEAAGADTTLQVWDGMVHVFQQFPRELAEAREARAAIGSFLRHHFERAAAAGPAPSA